MIRGLKNIVSLMSIKTVKSFAFKAIFKAILSVCVFMILYFAFLNSAYSATVIEEQRAKVIDQKLQQEIEGDIRDRNIEEVEKNG